MLDVSHNTKVTNNSIPDSATSLPPVRLNFCDELVWLRPSNVLRLEFREKFAGNPDRVVISLTDGKNFTFDNATRETADSIAELLWPSDTESK
jgi:hypothetical protein